MIKIRGAREHNLKNIDVDIPHNALVVVTGLSGSGKSSLAFDTLFAEGQRRFVESLSAYARQFLGVMQKPRLDHIEGLSPAIAIEQRNTGTGIRSTVGTSTDIYDYVRLLYAHIGVPHCPDCGSEITPQTREEITDTIMHLPTNARIEILAPVIRGVKGEHKNILERIQRQGFVRVRVDGTTHRIEDVPKLARHKRHTIEVVVDRIVLKDGIRSRIADSLETALGIGDGRVIVSPRNASSGKNADSNAAMQEGDMLFSQQYACPQCDAQYDFEELAPRMFSFNSPYGACATCHGLGVSMRDFSSPCPACHGARLKPYSCAVTVRDVSIVDFVQMHLQDAHDFIKGIDLTSHEQHVVGEVCKEIVTRLRFLNDVGIGYLTLERRSNSLSGGEAQRIRLASQIGTGLTGVLYVLDEPSIGLHARDNEKLLQTLTHLRDLGNTVVVVEHDEETIRSADYIIDLGPGAGMHGGNLIYQGEVEKLYSVKESHTAAFLTGAREIAIPERKKVTKNTPQLSIHDVTHNNLKKVTASFPLGVCTCVTGVSGSGKSSLVTETLLPALRKELYDSDTHPGAYKKMTGTDYIDKVIVVDQSPIGRTPRSNPATYTGVFTHIRNLYADLPESRARGYSSGRFSFNKAGGRCEACEGNGIIKIEMHFLPDVYVTCEACGGRRYTQETCDIRYRGKSIADVLDMTVEEAYDFFSRVPKIKKILKTLKDVGLGYIHLGQHATTLSGGEAQRVKLSNELAKRATGRTLYILDEPTTGLHFADVDKLLQVIRRLVDRHNTIIIIEHNMDVIKCADYIIDLGPDGGAYGGEIVAQGTPEEVAGGSEYATGIFLSRVLKHARRAENAA